MDPKASHQEDIAEEKSLTKKHEIKKTPPKKNNKRKIIFIIMVLFIILTLLIYLYLKNSGVFIETLSNCEARLKLINKQKPFLFYLIMFILIFVIFLFGLPGLMLSSIFCSIIISNLIKSFFIITIMTVISSIFIYLFAKFVCRNLLIDLFKDSQIIKVLKKEARCNPLKISFLIRFLFINGGIKEYFLVIIDVPFLYFLGSSIVCHSLFIFFYCVIGNEFNAIEQFIEHPKYWNQKSTNEKIFFFFISLTIFFSFVFIIKIAFSTQKKIKDSIIEEQNEKENVKYQNIEN
jgi:uncharacterized membrane protein YdjX (TVP38/TMEM64 family)